MTGHLLNKYENEFRTRLSFAYDFGIPYSTVTDRVRKGMITLHFVDGKVQINVAEALKACERKRPAPKSEQRDLFSAA